MSLERETTCCFTGHRPDKLPWGSNEEDERCLALKESIAREIEGLYRRGYRHFISGMARGADLYFVEAALALRARCPGLTVEGVAFSGGGAGERSPAARAGRGRGPHRGRSACRPGGAAGRAGPAAAGAGAPSAGQRATGAGLRGVPAALPGGPLIRGPGGNLGRGTAGRAACGRLCPRRASPDTHRGAGAAGQRPQPHLLGRAGRSDGALLFFAR